MRTSSTTDTCPLFTQAAFINMAIGVASVCLAIVGDCGEVVRVCFGLLGIFGVVAATRLDYLGAEHRRRQQEVQRRVADYRARHSIPSPETRSADLRSRFEEALATRNRLSAEAEASAMMLRNECNALKHMLKSIGHGQPPPRRNLRSGEVVAALQQLLAEHPQGLHRDELLPLISGHLKAKHDCSLVGFALRFHEALSSDLFLEHDGVFRLANCPPSAE
jgi:hypothetical protein